MSSVRRRLAGLACLPLLLVSACSDDPPSSAEPTPTVTTSVDPTPTQALETRDRVPEKAREQSHDGSVQFARYFIKVFVEAKKTLVTDDLRAMSADECETCAGWIEMIEDLAANGGSTRGGNWKVLQAGTSRSNPPGDAPVELRIRRQREIHIAKLGGQEETYPADVTNLGVFVQWVGDGWKVARLESR